MKDETKMIIIFIWIGVSAVLTFTGLILFSIHTQGDISDIDMSIVYNDYLIGVIGLCGLMGVCVYGMTFGTRRFI